MLNVVFLARDVDIDGASVVTSDEIAAIRVVRSTELPDLDAPSWTRHSMKRAAAVKALMSRA